ncbi:MAG TPA: [protein-PII] uridylyltransferase, partial [Actinomycetota bacterium]|nr:[protein-PII] uridylyltransferase [Actinomycetota bacterium]
AGDLRIERLATLEQPWGMALLPDGRLLITEKPGRLRVWANGSLSEPVEGVPRVVYRGTPSEQGGLMDVEVDPDFARNGLVYLSYSEAADEQPAGLAETGDPRFGGYLDKTDNIPRGGAVARGRLEGNRLRDVQVIWRQEPKTVGRGHFGNRLIFAPDGKLFITSGDRMRFDPAQSLASNLGKFVRINPDGSVPNDNPFAGKEGARGDIWSYGHRNVLVAAVGGYGRSELTPGSDIDLMFLFRGRNSEAARLASSAVLYPLWDGGFRVSHSARTVADCRAEARRRLDSLTALLSIRRLAGSAGLVAEASDAARGVVQKAPRKFLAQVEKSREERRTRFGSMSRALEPDLKESLGGHRDVQVLTWVVKALTERSEQVDDLEALSSSGLLGANDTSKIRRALDVLLQTRTALHRVAGASSNRLLAEHQHAVSGLLGYGSERDWEGRDALMRDLCIVGRQVEMATEAVLARAARSGRQGSTASLDLSNRSTFARSVMEAFAQVAEGGTALGPQEQAAVEDEGTRHGDLPWTPETLSAFLRILRSGEAGSRALEVMDSLDLLPRFIPEWHHVRGRPQRDPYHRFPVDVHLFTTAAETARLLRGADEAFDVEAALLIKDADALLLGALLHDIGKVGRGSHVAAGSEIAAQVLTRMGVADHVRRDVVFLVEEHLLLSDTATRRDLEDEDLVLHVAARVGDARRLAMLYLVTVADAASTGPAASTPWRMTLVRELVAKVNRAFERGLMDRGRAERLRLAEARVREALTEARPEDAERFLSSVPPSYLMSVEPPDAPAHLNLIEPRPGANELRTHLRPGRYAGSAILAVSAEDRVGLLASITGALTLAGFSIHSARAFTTAEGVALDIFEIRSAFEEEITEERWERLRSRMTRAADLGRLEAEVRSLREHYRPVSTDVPVEVRVDQEGSDFYTLVEVHGPDRMGLLFDLARTFSERGIDVHAARVATYGPRVVDVFYVTDSSGRKVSDPKILDGMVAALSEAAGRQ